MFFKRQYYSLRELRRAGVRTLGRDIFVSRQSTVCAGVTLHSPCHITGSSAIGAGSELVGGCRVEGAVIGKDCRVESSKITFSEVGDGCFIGPYCNIRAGCRVGARSRIGDFVELKACVLGEGCKAAHHAYIGDAELGGGVNVGCGAVFANYDGTKKSKSRVGDGAFIGCNCNIIAPAEIGAGAYIAAGSCVGGGLPQGAFAISRAPLRVKERGAGGEVPP